MKKNSMFLVACSALALAGCGADDVAAPGGPIVVPTPGPSPSPTPTPGAGSVTPAAGCTPGTTDGGTIVLQGTRGSIRNCIVPNQITGTLNLTARRADGVMYSMSGRTDVGRDVRLAGAAAATLNVSAGVTIFAQTRETSLIVNRGSKLNAEGTAANPIIFTALANLTGSGLTDATDNLWGGLIINGQAPVSDCDATVSTSNVGGDTNCWRKAEGVAVDTLFGGNVANDSSGIIKYVQVNFTGVGVNASEIQGITTGGVGSGTVMSYIQIHNSLDDGIESFGGTQNMDHLVMTGIADDSLDTDNGYRGSVQYLLASRRAAGTVGDSAGNQTMLEVDSSAVNDAQPRQYLRLANFTFLQNTPNEPAIRLRGGADVDLINGIVIAKDTGNRQCFDVDDAQTVQAAGAATDERGPPRLLSVVFQCGTVADADADTYEADTLNNPANSGVNQTFTSTLVTLTGAPAGALAFAPGTNELAVAAATGLPTISSFFTQVSYIGAFSGPGDTWTQGWTCNSDVAWLGGTTSCTDIRVS